MKIGQMTLTQKIKALMFFAFIATAVFMTIVAIRQRLVKPKAGAGQPILVFAVSTPFKAGADFDLTIKVNPNGASFNAFEFLFTFDDAKVELRDPANLGNNITKLFTTSLPLTQSVTGNKILISGAKTGSPFSGTSDIDIVKVKMKAKTGVTGSVSFNWNAETAVESLTLDKRNGVFTLAGGSAKLFFYSDKSTYSKGENLDLKLFLDTAGDQVKSVQFEFNYDDNVVTFQNTSGDLTSDNIVLNPSSGFDNANNLNLIDTTTKKVRIGLVTSSQVSGNIQLATVKLKIKNDASLPTLPATLSFAANTNSKIYNLQTQNILAESPVYSITIGAADLTPSPTDILSPTPTTGVTLTPTLTPSPTITVTPSITPVPTSPEEDYTIRIGDKKSLTINIGGITNVPLIHFKVKILAEKNPEIYVRLKATDMGMQLTPAPSQPQNTCDEPGWGEFFYKDIPLISEGERDADGRRVYQPKPNGQFTTSSGMQMTITSDGWVPLMGSSPGKIYAFGVKGEKHRNMTLMSNVVLENGKVQKQDFDWTDKPLEPGDVKDPNNSFKQDCVVNAIDAGFIDQAINHQTDVSAQLKEAVDLNYDGVINGADMSKWVDTTQKKPDDD